MNDLYQYPNPHMAAPQQPLVKKLDAFVGSDNCLYIMHNGKPCRVTTDSRGLPTVVVENTYNPTESQTPSRYGQASSYPNIKEQVVRPAPVAETKAKNEFYTIDKKTVSVHGNYNVSLNTKVQAEDFSRIKVFKDSVITTGSYSLSETATSICENYHDSSYSEHVHVFNYARMHYFYDTSLKEIVNKINFTTSSINDIYVDIKLYLSKATSLYDAYPLLYINAAITRDIDAYLKLYRPKTVPKADRSAGVFKGISDFIGDYETIKSMLPSEVYTDINERIMSKYKYNRLRLDVKDTLDSLGNAVYVCEAGVIAYTPYLTMELGYNQIDSKTVVLDSSSSAGIKAIFKEIDIAFEEDRIYDFVLVTRDKDIFKLISGNEKVALHRIR